VWSFNEPLLRSVMAQGCSMRFDDQEFLLASEGGARRCYFTVSYAPVRDERGRVQGVAVVSLDTTARVELERANADLLQAQAVTSLALADASRQKDDLLATLAHELRNPLAPIVNIAAILKQQSGGDEKLGRLGDVLRRQAGHMRRLIDDLLDTSRIGKGLLRLELAPVDLRAVIAAAVEQLAAPMKRAGHAFTLDIADVPMQVEGDSTRLIQVVANILHNAAKYTPPGGRISLRAAADAGWATVTVEDNGVGVEADFLAAMFEPFSQAQRSPGRTDNGLGLGLALVRSIVDLHGGTADAASPGVGLGSTFTLRLPLLPD
jgi:signal transduction histidine kinase